MEQPLTFLSGDEHRSPLEIGEAVTSRVLNEGEMMKRIIKACYPGEKDVEVHETIFKLLAEDGRLTVDEMLSTDNVEYYNLSDS